MSFADEHLSFRVPFAQSIGDEGERVKAITQTTFGDVYGNCFNASVASILELDEIPNIEPSIPDKEEWRRQWTEFFAARGMTWKALTWEDYGDNWDYIPSGYSIGNVNCTPESSHAVLHALVFLDGQLVHDPMPTQDFMLMPSEQRRKYPIHSFTVIEAIPSDAMPSGNGDPAESIGEDVQSS